jgi:MFS family permease
MPNLREVLVGPWRAVLVLGVTEILSWGVLFYPPVLMVPLMAADHGWSIAFTMGGFSLGLLAAGLISPRVGAAIDRHGGHRVMPFGSLIGACGLLALVHADHPVAYLAVWVVLGAAMAASLYDPAFATLGRIFGAGARPAITALTLAGGFASTVSWPMTHLLIGAVGWRSTYLIYAALLALVAAPLHAFALPRTRAEPGVPRPQDAPQPAATLSPKGLAFVLVATAFAAYAFVPSGLAAHLLAMFQRLGLDAATVVATGAESPSKASKTNASTRKPTANRAIHKGCRLRTNRNSISRAATCEGPNRAPIATTVAASRPSRWNMASRWAASPEGTNA